MKNEKKITETNQGNGVYIMDFKKDAFQVKGNTAMEKLQNAVKDFLKPEKNTSSSNITTEKV